MKPRYLFIIRLLITLFKITLSQTSTTLVWNEESLFNYTKINYFNRPYKKLINHLIVDPEKYIQDEEITNFKLPIESLINDYNIKNFLFLVNSVENSFSYSKFENLIYKINDYLNKNNDDFDPETLISTFISLKNSKIFIVRGNKIKKIISKKESDNLIKNIQKLLKSKKDSVDKIIKNYYEKILKICKKNEKLNKSFYGRYKNIIILLVIIIVIIICVVYFSGESHDFEHKISAKENKITTFLDKNIEKNLDSIMEKNCIICLDDYSNKKDVSDIKNNKTSTDNIDIDKFKLPCGHIFHNKCLLKWFLKETKCPLCKSVFKLQNNHNKHDNQIKIIKYTINKNPGFNNKNQLIDLIENFLQIQKKFNPHIISDSFVKELIKDYKNNLGKEDSSSYLIYSSPEKLFCKVMSSAETKIESKKNKYSKLDTSINITSSDLNQEDGNNSRSKL